DLPPRRKVGSATGAPGSPVLTIRWRPAVSSRDALARMKPTSEVRDVHSFAQTVPCPARRHGMDRVAPAHREDGSAAERAGRAQRPPNRRAVAEKLFLRPRLHQPVTARDEDLRIGWLWQSGRDRRRSR